MAQQSRVYTVTATHCDNTASQLGHVLPSLGRPCEANRCFLSKHVYTCTRQHTPYIYTTESYYQLSCSSHASHTHGWHSKPYRLSNCQPRTPITYLNYDATYTHERHASTSACTQCRCMQHHQTSAGLRANRQSTLCVWAEYVCMHTMPLHATPPQTSAAPEGQSAVCIVRLGRVRLRAHNAAACNRCNGDHQTSATTHGQHALLLSRHHTNFFCV
jgi:hypothetical protein